MTQPAVGVVGLGHMGGNMAKHLLEEGFDVVGYDISDDAVAELTDAGGERAASPAAVAEQVDVLITSLPNPDVVKAAFDGEDGILAGASDGLVVLEMSTSTPATTRHIDEQAGESVHVVDSPVDGGPENCRDGTLVILSGGETSVIGSEPARTVLDALSTKRYHAGPIGSGHMIKLLNNVMAVGNFVLAMEVVTLGVEAGVDGEVLLEILTNMSGSSNQLEKRFPRVLNRNFEPGFTVDLAKKDVGLAVESGREENVPVVVAGLIHQLCVKASADGYGGEDMSALVKLFEDAIGDVVESDEQVDESFGGY